MVRVQSRGSDQFLLRMPDGLRNRISAAAKANGRSMNAEIVGVLESHYPELPPLSWLLSDLEATLATINPVRDEYQARQLLRDRLEVIRESMAETGEEPDKAR